MPQARVVANAFVALGRYYLEGIPETRVKADPDRAFDMFSYAASFFGDPDAQYHLAYTLLQLSNKEEAMRLENSSPYALGGSVFSQNVEQAIEFASRMRAGTHIPSFESCW